MPILIELIAEIMSSVQTDQSGHSSAMESNPSHESLYTKLRSQVEFYFSPQNLSRDTYLRNMLTSEHVDMSTPRPLQHMCPVGIITNFPKVQYVCSQFGGQEEKPVESAALLLAKAFDKGSSVVTISPDGNWIGPINQHLPPLVNSEVTGVGTSLGNMPARVPHPFQTHPYQYQQQGYHQSSNSNQGMIGMVPFPPPSFPLTQQHHLRGEGREFMGQYQQLGMPYIIGASQVGSESPPSASLESLPQQQQQQQQIRVRNFQPPNVLMGSMTTVSSVPVPVLKGGESIPLIGQQSSGGAYSIPPGPSQPPPMIVNQNTSILPPYPIAPSMHQLSPPSSMSGGIQEISQSYLYYHPQQMQQAGYPQQGAAQNLMQQPQMPPYPPLHHIGYVGYPQHGYPPTFHAYYGMQQYVDYGGGGSGGGGGRGRGLHYHGYPLPPRLYYDRRRGASSPISQHIINPNHDGDGKKNRVDKKKQKNPQQQHTKVSYGSSSVGNRGSRNGELNNRDHLKLHGHSPSPPSGGHKGGGGANRPSSLKSGDKLSQFGRNRGDATPESFKSKKSDGNKVMFSSSDFPGLGGSDDQKKQQGEKNANSNLVGYASALLNKMDASNRDSPKNDSFDIMTALASATSSPSADDEVDSHTHRTEEIERKILSEFHDLSLLGNDNEKDSKKQGHAIHHDNKNHDESSTMDTSEDITSRSYYLPTSESSPSNGEPIIDVNIAVKFSTGGSFNEDNGMNTGEQQNVQPLLTSNDLGSMGQNSKVLWGSKRLFADVIKDGR
ncbi:hypothetical protein ACHAXA_011592 [Cyclostephanos tholiformis]|uniref:HTH La-type RNA-binding domain-containing protein n=1 Tax=Cyclostephanos tholiformis TaxID=382380 RepID=A0ABD3SGW8_9STRA